MELYDEEVRKNEYKNKGKLNRIITVAIISVVLVIIVLIFAIFFLINNPNKETIKLNGVVNASLEKMVEITHNNDGNITLSAPIKEFAKIVGYEAFNGEYLSSSQDSDKCHVIKNGEEVATFYLDSNSISKKDLSIKNSEYEYYDIGKNVFEKEGVLYVNDEGLERGFNVSMSYDTKKKILNIYTLDTENEAAKNIAVKKYGYTGIDEVTFANKKAVLDEMIVVYTSESEESEVKKYGVIDASTGKTVLEVKYDLVTYVPSKSEFFIKINNKVGIIDVNGQEKIRASYDDLQLIDKEKELYLAKNNNLYGVINAKGQTVIYLEYNQIGVDISKFEENGIKSGYILLNKLIPAKQGNKWGFLDITGKKVTDFIYDDVGAISKNTNSIAYNLLVVPEPKLVAVKLDEFYTFIDENGKQIVNNIFTTAYLKINSGVNEYYAVWNKKEYNVLDIANRKQT